MRTKGSRPAILCRIVLVMVTAVLGFFLPGTGRSAPPEYETFGRDQKVDYVYNEMDLLRIWVVYVGQGDGILIQLPKKYNYDPDPDDGIDAKSERNDIMIDGGSHRSTNAHLMLDFLQTLYDPAWITLENAIITHHDSDHILGLTAILQEPSVSVDNIYHNGLASHRYKGRIKQAVDGSAGRVVKKAKKKIKQVLAVLESDKRTIKNSILVDDLGELKKDLKDGLLYGYYEKLAKAIVEKQDPTPVEVYSRTWEGGVFIPAWPDISFTVIWPQKKLKAYSGWAETINGNSVTFFLKYNDFEMLFTGDQNEKSEPAMIEHLKEEGQASLIRCDVLKVPHHGSDHNVEAFIQPDGAPAVITVASMGETGFGDNWKHPSTRVIGWAGGAHRFYSTYIKERKFKWSDMLDEHKRMDMQELKHVLIETDGVMFRVVEVDAGSKNLNNPPQVADVKRSDGTRWIKAKP